MNLYTKQQQTQKTDLWLPKGRDGSGVWDQQMQTNRMDIQQGPTAQHRNYIQHPVINYNGKNIKNVYICITESL